MENWNGDDCKFVFTLLSEEFKKRVQRFHPFLFRVINLQMNEFGNQYFLISKRKESIRYVVTNTNDSTSRVAMVTGAVERSLSISAVSIIMAVVGILLDMIA